MRLLRALHLLLLSVASTAIAQPTRISEAEFTLLSAGMARVTEDFNHLPIGSQPSPLQLRNGVYTGSSSVSAPWCVYSRCLTLGNGATFSAFPNGTVAWSLRLISSGGGIDRNNYEFEVVGRSGTRVITVSGLQSDPRGVFIGFHDPRGLLQVRVRTANVGFFFGYSIDDVMVAVGNEPARPVPAIPPLGLMLLVACLLAAGGLALRRR